MMQTDENFYDQESFISAQSALPSTSTSKQIPGSDYSSPSSSFSSLDQSSRSLPQGSSQSAGSKRPASPDGYSDLRPPSPKRAGLACTVTVDSDEKKNESASTSKEGSHKDKESSPRKPKLEREDSAVLAEREAQRLKKEKQEEDRMKMKVLVSNFSEDQLDRYAMFRRAAFPKAAVRRLMQSISGSTISQNVVIAMAGIAKVFVGEIVEEALDAMEKCKETGPIQPKHIRESVRKLRAHGALVNTKYKKKLFR